MTVAHHLAKQLLELTRVTTNAPNLAVGEPLRIDVVPASLPVVGIATGLGTDLTSKSLGVPIRLSVKYEVFRDGKPAGKTFASIPRSENDSADDLADLLSVALVLLPVFTDESDTRATEYEVRVTLAVYGPDGPKAPPLVSRTVVIPVSVPAIQIPAVAVMGSFAHFNPVHDGKASKYLIQVRAGGPSDIDELLETYNSAIATVGALTTTLPFLTGVVKPLQMLVKTISRISAPNFARGDIANMHEKGGTLWNIFNSGFDNEMTSILIVGMAGRTLQVSDKANPHGWISRNLDPETEYGKNLVTRDVVDLAFAGDEKGQYMAKALGLAKIDPVTKALEPVLDPALKETATGGIGLGVFYVDDFKHKNTPLSLRVFDNAKNQTKPGKADFVDDQVESSGWVN